LSSSEQPKKRRITCRPDAGKGGRKGGGGSKAAAQLDPNKRCQHGGEPVKNPTPRNKGNKLYVPVLKTGRNVETQDTKPKRSSLGFNPYEKKERKLKQLFIILKREMTWNYKTHKKRDEKKQDVDGREKGEGGRKRVRHHIKSRYSPPRLKPSLEKKKKTPSGKHTRGKSGVNRQLS